MSADAQINANSSSFLAPQVYPGKLISAEGLDGSGKSTQLQLLQYWLQAEGYRTVISEWRSSKFVKRTLNNGRKQGNIDPMLMSILHAADFAEHFQRDIVPALQSGFIVLADRYIATALVRDLARGVEASWITDVYRFALQPDLTIYFQISVDQSLERILSHNPQLQYYQAGMDLELSLDPVTSFRMFQQRLLFEYENVLRGQSLLRIDATLPAKEQQRRLRASVTKILPAAELS